MSLKFTSFRFENKATIDQVESSLKARFATPLERVEYLCRALALHLAQNPLDPELRAAFEAVGWTEPYPIAMGLGELRDRAIYALWSSDVNRRVWNGRIYSGPHIADLDYLGTFFAHKEPEKVKHINTLAECFNTVNTVKVPLVQGAIDELCALLQGLNAEERASTVCECVIDAINELIHVRKELELGR